MKIMKTPVILKAMKKAFIFSLFVLTSCQHQPSRELASEAKIDKATQKQIKAHFKKISEEERIEALKKARVPVRGFDPKQTSSIDLIADMEKTCGEKFRYQKVTKGSFDYDVGNQSAYEVFQWPRVDCRYRPDDGDLGGYSTKFLCDFESSKAKDGLKTIKVKYARKNYKPLSSEVVETILSTQMTKLVGFYTESYCPAEVVCHNCPSSNPWENNRASSPPGSGSEQFQWAILESPLNFVTMTSRPPQNNQAQGLEWTELKLVQNENPDLAKQMLIEREAWMLWLNFLQHQDAKHFNQRLSCEDPKIGSDGRPVCDRSVVYTHDFGHSFLWDFDLSTWLRKPALRNGPSGDTCHGTLEARSGSSYTESTLFSPGFSAEARDFLVSRMEQVTDQQWITAYQLSRAEEATKISSATWLQNIRSKIKQMKSADCLPLESGRSVLAR